MTLMAYLRRICAERAAQLRQQLIAFPRDLRSAGYLSGPGSSESLWSQPDPDQANEPRVSHPYQ